MKVLVIIPVYNESKNILKVIDEIKKEKYSYDILAVNDASTDNTLELLQKEKINVISNVFNMGYAHSIQLGIKYAYKYSYDYAVLFDGDTQHIASYIPKLIERSVETNSDLVIGSRYLDGEYKQNFFRLIGTKLFSIIIKVFCHKKITDPLSGMQCLNKRVIKYYSCMENYPNIVDANLIIELLLKGYKISEVPVKMRHRESGVSMHSGILKPIKYMISIIYSIIVILLLNIRRSK